MSRFLYNTAGFVLSGRPVGEANRLFDLFTNRLGRVTALATGVRELKSKLRYTLQDLSPVRLGLICGRSGWRIVHAEPNDLSLTTSRFDRERKVRFAPLLNLLSRLVVAEGRRPSVYRELEQAFLFLTDQTLTPDGYLNYELISTLRLLATLGYWPGSDQLSSFVPPTAWQKSEVEKFTPHRRLAAIMIEEAMYHSHL